MYATNMTTMAAMLVMLLVVVSTAMTVVGSGCGATTVTTIRRLVADALVVAIALGAVMCWLARDEGESVPVAVASTKGEAGTMVESELPVSMEKASTSMTVTDKDLQMLDDGLMTTHAFGSTMTTQGYAQEDSELVAMRQEDVLMLDHVGCDVEELIARMVDLVVVDAATASLVSAPLVLTEELEGGSITASISKVTDTATASTVCDSNSWLTASSLIASPEVASTGLMAVEETAMETATLAQSTITLQRADPVQAVSSAQSKVLMETKIPVPSMLRVLKARVLTSGKAKTKTTAMAKTTTMLPVRSVPEPAFGWRKEHYVLLKDREHVVPDDADVQKPRATKATKAGVAPNLKSSPTVKVTVTSVADKVASKEAMKMTSNMKTKAKVSTNANVKAARAAQPNPNAKTPHAATKAAPTAKATLTKLASKAASKEAMKMTSNVITKAKAPTTANLKKASPPARSSPISKTKAMKTKLHLADSKAHDGNAPKITRRTANRKVVWNGSTKRNETRGAISASALATKTPVRIRANAVGDQADKPMEYDQAGVSKPKKEQQEDSGVVISTMNNDVKAKRTFAIRGVPSIGFRALVGMQVVGRGGFGTVSSAFLRGERVAVKEVLEEKMSDHVQAAFEDEVRMMARLRHANIVTLKGVVVTDGELRGAIMEHASEGNLLQCLMYQKDWTWSTRKLEIAIGVASAITYMHTRSPPVIHRDLKSENVLYDVHQGALLCDFGLAMPKTDEVADHVFGTWHAMAPEVGNGNLVYNEAVDVYGLGRILHDIDTDGRSCPRCEHAFNDFHTHQPGVGYLECRECARLFPTKIEERVKACHRCAKVSSMSANERRAAVAAGRFRPILQASSPKTVRQLIQRCTHPDPSKRPSAADVVRALKSMYIS